MGSKETLTQKRMAENQVIFRERNETVPKGFDEVKKIASEEGQLGLVHIPDTPLFFVCECSDPDCKERIPLTVAEYEATHANRDSFCVAYGHQVSDVEDVKYEVVKKHVTPPEHVSGDLRNVPVNNHK